MMYPKLLSLFTALFLALQFQVTAQAQTGETRQGWVTIRGEMTAPSTDLAKEARSLKLDILVTEIEDAGFEEDVQEGFEEEWEEEFWVESDDDVSSLYVNADDMDFFDTEEDLSADELAEDWDEFEWDNPETLLHDDEEVVLAKEDEALEQELLVNEWDAIEEEEEFAMVDATGFDFSMDDLDSWEDLENYDETWNDIMEEWELEEMEEEYELDDIDLMEALYEAS